MSNTSIFLNMTILFWILAFCQGCKQKTAESTVTAPSKTLEFDSLELNQLKTEKRVLVKGFESNHRNEFFASERESEITQFPCSSCHDSVLKKSYGIDTEKRSMHVDINLKHAKNSVMHCDTCHNFNDMDTLTLINKKPVSINEGYRMCAQCHFQQANDWAGGAHGKRLAGWQGKRVIMNCTECHNPHAPAIKSRWPMRYPSIPRK